MPIPNSNRQGINQMMTDKERTQFFLKRMEVHEAQLFRRFYLFNEEVLSLKKELNRLYEIAERAQDVVDDRDHTGHFYALKVALLDPDSTKVVGYDNTASSRAAIKEML
jgi:hypothetical protein